MTDPEAVLVRLAEAYRRRYGIPDAYVPAPLPLDASVPPDALLRLLQQHAASWSGWQTLEPLWERLADQLGRDGPLSPELDVEAADWCLRLGLVNLGGTIITLQRSDHLLAAIRPQLDGRLVAAVYRPLDARALAFLIGLAVRPLPDGTVSMRPNNWEFALDQTVGIGQAYAADAGSTYLSFWEHGLGLDKDGGEVSPWYEQHSLTPRPPCAVAAELRAFVRWPKPPRLKLSLARGHVGTEVLLNVHTVQSE